MLCFQYFQLLQVIELSAVNIFNELIFNIKIHFNVDITIQDSIKTEIKRGYRNIK